MGAARGHTWEAEAKDASRRKCSVVLCCSEKESWLGSTREELAQGGLSWCEPLPRIVVAPVGSREL